MASNKNPSDSDSVNKPAKRAPRDALVEWAAAVSASTSDLLVQLGSAPHRIILTDEEQTALAVVNWLASVMGDPPPRASDAARIRRMNEVFLPARRDGQRVVAAVELVEEYGDKYRELPKGLPPHLYDGPANELILELEASVHENFGALAKRRAEVLRLLARYEPTKGRRSAAGKPGKLSAAGVVCELNKMVQEPLGHGLNQRTVANARTTWSTSPAK
jgi:hypothetical protein